MLNAGSLQQVRLCITPSRLWFDFVGVLEGRRESVHGGCNNNNNVNVHVTRLTQQSTQTGPKGRSVVVRWKKDVSVKQDAVAFQFVLLSVIRELTSQSTWQLH